MECLKICAPFQPRPWTQVIGGHAHKTYHLWCNDFYLWQPAESASRALQPPVITARIAAMWPAWEMWNYIILPRCKFCVRFSRELVSSSGVFLCISSYWNRILLKLISRKRKKICWGRTGVYGVAGEPVYYCFSLETCGPRAPRARQRRRHRRLGEETKDVQL